MMFNHIKKLMRKEEQSIKVLNCSGITVNDENEFVKKVERFWGKVFCTNGKAMLGDGWEWYD